MKNNFVSYEIALALKELGFNEECFTYYDGFGIMDLDLLYSPWVNSERDTIGFTSAPLYQQVFEWFIKEHNMFIDVFKWSVKYYVNDELLSPRFLFDIDTYNEYSDDWIYQSINDELKYASYYEAREAAILKTIDLIKNKQYGKFRFSAFHIGNYNDSY